MRSTADAPWNSQRPVRVTTQAQQWTPGLESQSLPKEAKTQSPSVPLALKFRSRIMIAIRNGEPSVDNTDISLGGAHRGRAIAGSSREKHLRTGLTSGTETRMRPKGTRPCTQLHAAVDNTRAELLRRGFVSVFRTGRGRLPVAVLGGFRPRRSQEQFASQSTPN